jgi:hypothetical protein
MKSGLFLRLYWVPYTGFLLHCSPIPELKRGRYCWRMVVVVEGSLSEVGVAARGLHHNAIIGSLAAWTLRYCPFVFAGSERIAADFAFRFLGSQVRQARRLTKAASQN